METNKKIINRSLLAKIFFLGMIATGIFSGFLIIRYIQTYTQLYSFARAQAKQKAETAAKELDTFISMLKPIANNVAKKLSTKPMSSKEIEKELAGKPKEIFGLYVAFRPFAFNKEQKLYAPYFYEKEGKPQLVRIDASYDYSAPEYTWFHRPLKKGPGFLKPYIGKESKTIIIDYAVPFHLPGQSPKEEPSGVVYANQSISHLQHVLSTLYLGKNGYWFILSKDGTILAHPKRTWALERKNMLSIAQNQSEEFLHALKHALKGKKSFAEYNNEITDAPSWLFCEPIPATGWVLCGVFDQGELPIDHDILRQKLIHIGCALALCLIFLVLWLSCLGIATPVYWWIPSILISAILAANLSFMWYVTGMYPDYKENIRTIDSKQDLFSFVEQHVEQDTKNKVEVKVPEIEKKQVSFTDGLEQEKLAQLTYSYQLKKIIPTGIYINHLRFIKENEIEIVGTIWQRYYPGIHDTITRGFILPQATAMTIKETVRTKEDDVEKILWFVQATLNQQLSYDRYPFDVKNLQIHIMPKDINKDIILIPDLDAYRLLNPRSLPGINPNADLEGWYIQGSHFGYTFSQYNTTFGMYNTGPFGIYKEIDLSTMPELYFDIIIKRHLLETIIADLVPLMIIALLLFVILLTSIAQGYAILGSCATVFFGIVIAQARFREKIPTTQLIYFEYFYLVMYVAVLVVVVTSFLYLLPIRFRWIDYEKNLIAKLLYWPAILLTLNTITVWYLY